MSLPRSFRELLIGNLSNLFSWRPFAILVSGAVIILIEWPSMLGIRIIERLLGMPIVWFGVIMIYIADSFIGATVWYFQERNPRYIAKMAERERIEQEKQEKADALKEQNKNPSADE